MWCMRWAGWVALVTLVVGLVLGEPRLSFHPPVYLYEFGDLGDQTVHFATVGHIRPGQQFAKVELNPFPCVRRVRFVRVAVLNAHNPAHVSVRGHSIYIQYARAENPRSTYIVWASRTGPMDPTCLHQLKDMTKHQKRINQYQLQDPTALQPRQGYPPKHGYYPGHVTSPLHGQHQGWSGEDADYYEFDNKVQGRNGDITNAKNKAHLAVPEDSFSEYSSESRNVDDKPNNDQFHKENNKKENEAKDEPIWKLKRQRKNNANKPVVSTPQVNKVEVQDVENPFNMTETVKFGLNATVFRRISPMDTVSEEIIEEIITPEEFISRTTNPDGMTVIPGFTYQFFNLPSSSEATMAHLPSPENLPKDESEWGAYFKNLMENNSSMVITERPVIVAAGFTEPV